MACTTYGDEDILSERRWVVELADEFESELDELPEAVQDEVLAHAADKRFDRHLESLRAKEE